MQNNPYGSSETLTEGVGKRQKVEKFKKSTDDEFAALGLKNGFFYASANIENEGIETNHDGQGNDSGELKIRILFIDDSRTPRSTRMACHQR